MPEFKSTINVEDNYTLPTADGSEKQILETDGAGNVDWQDNPSYKLVRNDSGSTIGAGNIVRINDSFGSIPTIVVADNSTCSCADGITIESIANGANGLIQLKGVIQESFINTNALTAGNVAYLSTSGGYTDVKPTSGFVVKVGKVGVEAPSNGSLLLSMPAYAMDFEDLSGELELDQINATGTADNTTYLRGDGTWSTVSASGSAPNPPDREIIFALGETSKAATCYQLERGDETKALSSGLIFFDAIWIDEDVTISEVEFLMSSKTGVYNANNYNGVGLYTHSAGTLTLVASTTNDGNLWKAPAQSRFRKAFSSAYSATRGLHYIAYLHSSYSQTTTPEIYRVGDTTPTPFYRSEISSYLSGTTLPASTTLASLAGWQTRAYIYLY